MTEYVKIVNFNPEWLDVFENYKTIIAKAKCTLVGSAAVPMKGKEEIDIIVEVANVEKAQEALHKAGFGKGPIENGVGYARDYRFGIECELHIMLANHPKKMQAVELVKRLQANDKLRLKFEKFKESCDGISREEYRKRKAKFLEKIEIK